MGRFSEMSVSDPSARSWRPDPGDPVLHLQVLLALAVILGGGGAAYALRNLAIQLFALALLAWHSDRVAHFCRQAPLALRLLVLATLALPLLQLVPLPQDLWQGLPGREPAAEALRLAGYGESVWSPASLDRARTLVAFIGLIAPATIVVLGAGMTRRQLARLGWTLVACAVLALIWGGVQLASANTMGLLYPVTPKPDVLYATFANRNSTGLLFVCGSLLVLGLARLDHPLTMIAGGVSLILLLLGVALTQSRSSIVLLAMPVLVLLLRLVADAIRTRGFRRFTLTPRGLMMGGIGLALVAGLAVAAVSGGRISESLARFDDGAADRPEMWEDGLYAAGQYWPVGAGMGTFDEVFQLHESLEHISPRRAGRAHNDYIELAIESGVAGLIIVAAWLAWALVATFGHMRTTPYWPGIASGFAVCCIALQSLLDYPLRNQSLLCLAGLLVVFLASKLPERRAT
jgi:O-antigen ligase